METEKKKRGRPVKAPQEAKIEPQATSVAVVPQQPPKQELVLQGDPEAQMRFAMKAANALMGAVGQKKNKVMIRGEQYLEYGDWQMLGRFFGATASITWSKKLEDKDGRLLGYEARAEVLHNGQVISSAEAMCMKAEKNWNSRDEFMLRSMAQTRAAAKALRNAYGWVAELAGMKATPAEEMDGVEKDAPRMTSYKVERKVPAADDEAQGAVIQEDKQFLENEEIIAVQKDQIKDILISCGHEPQTKNEAEEIIMDITALELKEENYGKILEKLRIYVDSVDPLATAIKK